MAAAELTLSFANYMSALEKELRALKSITNLRALGSDIPVDISDKLRQIESSVNSVEYQMDGLDVMLEEEDKCLDRYAAELQEQTDQQTAMIGEMMADMPPFMKNMLTQREKEGTITITNANAPGSSSSYRREKGSGGGGGEMLPLRCRPITIKEFQDLSSSTRGRQSYEQVNEAMEIVSRLMSNKMKSVGDKANFGAGRDYNRLRHSDHDGAMFLTEPEIRATSLFKAGETTGRAVLHSLRALHRLKVVRTNGENTFVLI